MSKRATIFLKSASGPKPYRTVYFSEEELERLMKDMEQYQKTGEPREGMYVEEVASDQSVYVEFGSIAHIKTNV